MNKFEFYKELYHKENERKSEINNSYRIPVVIISALASGFYFLLTSYVFKISDFFDVIFILLLILTVFSILISCYYVICSFDIFKNFEYKGIPSIDELNNWHEELHQYYKKNKKKANKKYENGIINHFIEIIQFNTDTNDKKHRCIYLSKQYSVIGLTFLLISFAPYFYNYFSKPKSIEKTEVVFDKEYFKDIKTLNIKIDSLTNIISKLKTEIMCAKKTTTSPPPPPPKVRTYSDGGKITAPKPSTTKSK